MLIKFESCIKYSCQFVWYRVQTIRYYTGVVSADRPEIVATSGATIIGSQVAFEKS